MAAFPVAAQIILQQNKNEPGPPTPAGPAIDYRLKPCRTAIREISDLFQNAASPLGNETLKLAIERLNELFESRCDTLEDARLEHIKVDLEKDDRLQYSN